MSHTVKLSDELVSEAKRIAALQHRSVPKQIEHWSRIGRLVEQNPDLPYQFIMDILASRNETPEPFEFGRDD
jgi:hypothetical protein